MIIPNSSFPVFIIEKIDEAKLFYSSHFGFAAAFENEWYLHLVSESGIQVGFMLPSQPTQPDIFNKAYDGNGIIFSLEVNDADFAYTEAKKYSLDIVLELRSEDWG
ncbi:MAG: glyoxalase, partial [Deltaproteobacteria bacterium]|nr:glyoxalase [Deltaproteobacteria bacterium]